jgi:hypothetical protein
MADISKLEQQADLFFNNVAGWEIKHAANGWLCPRCVEVFNETINKFMQI